MRARFGRKGRTFVMLKRANRPQFAALCSSVPRPSAALRNQLDRHSIASIIATGFPTPNRRRAYDDLPRRNAGADGPRRRARRLPNDASTTPQAQNCPFAAVAKNRPERVLASRPALNANTARRYLPSNGGAWATQQARLIVPQRCTFKPTANATQRTSKLEPVESPTSKPRPNLHRGGHGGLGA
jgi:hypothetical protein